MVLHHLLFIDDEQKSKSSVYNEEKEKYKRQSRNSIDSDDTMDNSLSANEGGYLSDVSTSGSPSRPPDIISHHRRRSRPSDSIIDRINNNGSVSDTDEDNVRLRQFERKPPRGKSSRRKNQQSVEESKGDSYNGSRKRFSWTDSGISSSIGTGPKKFPFMTSNERVDKSKSTEEIPRMRNIVYDTFNAVNELKDLQRSFRRAHSEHKLCRFFPDSDSAISSSQQDNMSSQARVIELEPPPLPPDVIIIDAKAQPFHTDTKAPIVKMDATTPTSNTDAKIEKSPNKNFINKEEMDNFRITDEEIEDEEQDFHVPNNMKLEPDHVIDFNYDELSEQISIQDIRHLSSDRPPKSKGFINGLKKVASHLKPSFRTNAPVLSKDVSSEFSFAKRKNDEDTIKELHTITSKFRKEITHIQNISIDNLDLGGSKMPLDEENIQNMLLDRLSVKPNSTTTFIQKVFGRTRSYNAKPCKKNNNRRKSFCENVFITPCNADTYSPVSESNNYSRRTDMHNRKGKCNSVSTEEHPYLEYTSSSMSHDDEESYLENICVSPCEDEEHLEHETSGRHCIPDNQSMHVQDWKSETRLRRPRSLSHTQGSRDSQRSFRRSHVDTHESLNNSNGGSQRGDMNSCPQVYSHSSLDLHRDTRDNRDNSGEFLKRNSDCPQCAYNDYLEYLQFLRFRDSRCDVGYIWPQDPYGGNVYSCYADHNYQQCSESSGYPPAEHEYNGDMVSDKNRSNIRLEAVDDTRKTKEPREVYLESQPKKEIIDTPYGTYV